MSVRSTLSFVNIHLIKCVSCNWAAASHSYPRFLRNGAPDYSGAWWAIEPQMIRSAKVRIRGKLRHEESQKQLLIVDEYGDEAIIWLFA